MDTDTSGLSDEVRTESRIHSWWLSWFKGYEVKLIIRKKPRVTMFRRIKYDTTWVMIPRSSDDESSTGRRA